jgi:hypothetical protein
MFFFQRSLIILTIFMQVTGLSYANSKQDLTYRSFWHPTYHQERLNYCSLDGKICGLKLATQYCKSLGYARATHAIKAYNLGFTHYFPTKDRCKGSNCHGFVTINCAKSDANKKAYHYREKRFVVPRFNNYRVDFCYDKQKGCGKQAANAFCANMGYSKAVHFKRETNLFATQNLGQKALCFGVGCQGFKYITCFR